MAIPYMIKISVLLFCILGPVSCDAVDEDSNEESSIAIYFHDTPAGYDELNIHIRSISVVYEEEGTEIVVGEPDVVVNVLELVNDNKLLLGETGVEPGRYTDIIINWGTDNSVVINGDVFELDVREESVTIRHNFSIGQNESKNIYLDLDAGRSVVFEAGYVFDPEIRVYGDSDGTMVSGAVLPGDIRTEIRMRRSIGARHMVASTHTEENTGEFTFSGIESNVYDVELEPGTSDYNQVVHRYFRLDDDEESVSLGTYKLGASELLQTGEEWFRRELTPGVELLQRHFDDFDGVPRFIHIIAYDTDQPDVQMGIYIPLFWGNSPHRTAISDFGEHARALVATNAGFAPGGADYYNYGIIKIDGEVYPYVQKGTDEYWDELLIDLYFFGSSAVGIDYEGNFHFRQREGETWDDDWPEMRHAIAGGHRVLKDGELMENIAQGTYQNSREQRHMMTQHPRTALCHTADGVAALFAIDGRHDEAVGMSLLEMGEFMLKLGCVDAINFDGGGSTTMWAEEFGVVNHPTGNNQFDHEGQRNLRNALIIRVIK